MEQDVLGQLIRILFMVTAQVAPLHERLPLDCVQLIVEQLAAMAIQKSSAGECMSAFHHCVSQIISNIAR